MDIKTIRLLAIIFLLANTSVAHAIGLSFENKPELGIPDDAHEQNCKDSNPIGSLKEIIQKDTVTHIKIRYFNDNSMDTLQVERLVNGLFEDDRTQVYCFPAWANVLMEPNIEGVIYYNNLKKGQLLIWDFQACIRNPDGKWLFIMFPKDIKEQKDSQKPSNKAL